MILWVGAGALSGRRILVVEDEMMVAMLVEDVLMGLGCEVVGPAASVADALSLVANERLDAAVLDVNLGRETVFPVADTLKRLAVPFVFVTGYGRSVLTQSYARHPLIQKPFEPAGFGDALVLSLADAES